MGTNRAWRVLIATVGAGAVVAAGIVPAQAGPSDDQADRAAWTDEERRAHGQSLWPDREDEDVVDSSEVPLVDDLEPTGWEAERLADAVTWPDPAQEVLEVATEEPHTSTSSESEDADSFVTLRADGSDRQDGDALATRVELTVLSSGTAEELGVAGVVFTIDPVATEAEPDVPAGSDAPVEVDSSVAPEAAIDPEATVDHPDEPAPDELSDEPSDPSDVWGSASPTPSADVPEPEPNAQPVLDDLTVTVDFAEFADALGGDWAARVRLVSLPDCDPEAGRTCTDVVPLDTTVDAVARTASAVLPAGSGPVTMALTGGSSGSTGDWGATSLSPSAAWNVSAQTGAFSWSYPLRVPPGLGGPEPSLALGYSSSSVDGRVAATNNQTSWIGDGWDMAGGFIERRYVACALDQAATTAGAANNATHKSGDLCWRDDNASLSLAGHAGELVKDAVSGTWRLKADDGTRIERLTGGWNAGQGGEYWRVTTPDGTQYYFGREKRSAGDSLALSSAWTVPVFGNHPGEPCYATTFAGSSCSQVWRWNLDYVVDPSGNSMTYVYEKETNGYGRNNNTAVSQYVRGGYLARIDYAQRAGAEGTNAPARVEFTVAERCLPSGSVTCAPGQLTAANASHWPDVPFDLICTSGTSCPAVTSPVFFTRKRLTEVTTKIWSGTAYSSVDSWTLTHAYPDPGDATSKALWLSSIQHRGLAGSPAVTLPAVSFTGEQLANRVDTLGDYGPPMNRYRMSSITSEAGGVTTISYTPADCTSSDLPASPQTNTRRCFPVYWDPEGSIGMIQEYFHKYLVSSIADDPADPASQPVVTSYAYTGGAAWHYDDNPFVEAKYRTWGEYRGYEHVEVTTGDTSAPKLRTTYQFFRGMNGDRAAPSGGTRSVSVDGVADEEEYGGTIRRETTWDGTTEVERTTNTPWRSTPSATGADGTTARYSGTAVVETSTPGSALPGGARTTRVSTTFDLYGMPSQVEDLGDVATPSDDLCTRTEYARSTSANILGTVKRVETVGVACGTTAVRPGDVVSDVRTSYDGLAHGASPTKGLATKVERVASYSGTAPVYQTVTTSTYDANGRVLTVSDALARTTSTAYTTASGGLVTAKTVTSPDPDGSGPLSPHVTATTLDPAWGLPTRVSDPNGKITSGTYDALGRLTQVWKPGRVKGTHTPNVTYAYGITGAGQNAVTTGTLIHDATYLTSVALYDGLLRPRQVQTPTADRSTAGRIVTDTVYDARGLQVRTVDPWYTSGSPAATVVMPATAVPSRTVLTYDGAGRQTAAIYQVAEVEKWRTTTAYDGDRVHVDPPDGSVATTQISDARGRPTQLWSYTGPSPSGAHHTVTYAYDRAGNRTGMTDAMGNTWSWGFDLRGRQVTRTDPDTGTTTSVYDNADQLTSTTDGRGVTVATVYDNAGRRTQLRQGSASGTLLASWAWDTLQKGQVTSSTRYEGGNQYVTAITAYDDGYRPLGRSVTIPAAEGSLAGTYTVTYTYTLDGQLKSTKFPTAGGLNTETVGTFYDSRGVAEWMGGGLGWGVYVAGTQYSVYGEPLVVDLGSSYSSMVNYSYEYGTRRLEGTWLERETASTYDIDLTYDYDAAGNIKRIGDAAASADTQCFTYDDQRRLTGAWTPSSGSCATAPSTTALGGPAPYWQSYAYDAAGNRTGSTVHAASGNRTTTYTRPAEGTAKAHTLTSSTTTGPAGSTTNSYTYDAAGNTLTRTIAGAAAQTLTWDIEGRLDTLTQGGVIHDYTYTADGERLIRREGATTTVYLPGGEELTRAGATGAVKASRYYTFGGETVAVRTATGAAGVNSLVSDHHDTPGIAINNATNALTRRYHDPFGNPRGSAPLVWSGDHGFLNKPTDGTGLTQIGARYYDPGIGAFISPDPILDTRTPQQWNPYPYAENNPTTYADPTGLLPTWRIMDNLGAPPMYLGRTGGAAGGMYADSIRPGIQANAPKIMAGTGAVTRYMNVNAKPITSGVPKAPVLGSKLPTSPAWASSGGPGSKLPKTPDPFGATTVIRATPLKNQSAILGARLEASGVARPPQSAAHHIVAVNSPKARVSRELLERFGININDVANGVFLPANRSSFNPAGSAVHSTLHTDSYYKAVDEMLSGASSRSEVLALLDQVRFQLQQGGFP